MKIRCGHFQGNVRAPAPLPAEDYVEALLAIYRNPRIPLRLVSPISWVSERLDSPTPLISSPASVGAELAVLPNGDLYAGRQAVGLERWRLGNVLEDPKTIRWERLDVMAEAFSNAAKPQQCRRCDWRYRCGGVDASVLLFEEALSQGRPGLDETSAPVGQVPDGGRPSPMFELYCEPRKRLFEEMLWDSAQVAAQGHAHGPRERIRLHEDGIDYVPVNGARGPSTEGPGAAPVSSAEQPATAQIPCSPPAS